MEALQAEAVVTMIQSLISPLESISRLIAPENGTGQLVLIFQAGAAPACPKRGHDCFPIILECHKIHHILFFSELLLLGAGCGTRRAASKQLIASRI